MRERADYCLQNSRLTTIDYRLKKRFFSSLGVLGDSVVNQWLT
jgi:hypothetical protein